MTRHTPPPDRIQWHEGQLLCPQHFQQESGRVDALIAWHGLAANPYGWGVRALALDESLLVTGVLRIMQVDAVMPDGTAVVYDAQTDPETLQLDLKPWVDALEVGEVDLFLCMGRARSMRHPSQPSRFRGVASAPMEDEVSDALEVEVPRMRLQLSLAAGDAPPAAFVSMRLMSLLKVNEVVKRGRVQPPLLDLGAQHPIRERAHALVTQLRSKAAFVARQTANPSSRLEDRLTALEQRERLSSLTQALPLVEALVRSPSLHPYALYLALCVQLGLLARLRPGAVPLQPTPWNQADPMAGLEPLLGALEDLAGDVSQDWRTEVFRFDGRVFELPLEASWIGKRLVLGMRGRPEAEQAAWLEGAVIGSRNVWTSLSDRRMLGAPRQRVQDAPELSLRANSGYTLFAIEPAAEFVVAEQPLLVSNANESTTIQRPLELVLFVKG